MDQFFAWPVTLVAAGLAAAVAALLGAFALLGWRARVLLRLGTRNVPRRPARAALIVFGLALSTTVVGGAFGTGDTMTYTLQSLVGQSLGTVDEVVVQRAPRLSRTDQLKALAGGSFGSLANGNLGYFDQDAALKLQQQAARSGAIAATAPAIVDQVAAVHPDSQQLQASLVLLAVQAPYPDAFGPLVGQDGRPVALQALGPDEIVLNAAAADAFGASAGQPLRLLIHGVQWDVRIAAIVRNGGFGGVQPLLLAPLARYQQVTGRVGEVNELLVANRGGDQSVAQSAAATQDLRLALVDRATARQVHDFLAQPEVQRALIDAEAHLKDQERAQVVALRTEAAKPEVTDRFISLVSDPVARRQLFTFAQEIPSYRDRAVAFNALRRLAPLSVLELKQQGLDQAAEYGAVVTTVFLVLGIFSIAASVLLIFLVFALLAADRGAELATMRALGMRRRQIMGLFLFEGLIYDLAGAALGAAAGVGATYLAAGSLAQSLAPFGLHVARHVEPRSLLLAFCAGVLLTFGTMLLAAWRVSHTQIVAATRGEAVAEGHWGLVGVGALLLLGAWLAWRRWSVPPIFYKPRPPLLVPGVLSLVLLGAVCMLLAAPALWRTRGGEALAGGLGTLAGLGLLAIWLRALASLPTPGGELRDDAITVAIGGLVLIVAAVWTATRALGPLARGLDRALSGLARLRLLVRPAAGYLARQRWRTGLTVVMFGMVIFIMVAALTLINVLLNAYAANTAPVAGFELRADARGAAIPDMGAALARAPAVSRASFGAIGGVSTLDLQVVQLGLPASSWHDATVAAVDDGFLGGVQVGFARRAPGYRDDAAVWRALRERPGAAVVSASLLDTAVAVGGAPEDGTMPPATLWARPSDGGKPVNLTIIGVLDARAELDPAIYTSRATAAGLGVPLPDPTTYYFAVAPGVKVADAAQGLQVSFADQSLAVTDLGDTLRIGQSIRLLLTRLVQGFMGLGLVAGVAALGIIGVQAVIERRQQLGTLRALGYTRWQVRGTLAFESAVVAVLGIALGVALGLVLAHSLVALLGAAHPEVRFAVPAAQLALTAAVAWLGATLAIVVAAWQAGRVSPADALRVA